MRKLGVLIAVAFLVGLSTPGPAQAAADPLIIIGGTSFDLTGDPSAPEVIALPVALSSKTHAPTVRVSDVTFGQRRTNTLLYAVTAQFTRADPRKLVLTIGQGQLKETGTYTVDLVLTPRRSPSQVIVITLTRPPAALGTPASISTIRTRSYLTFLDGIADDAIRVGSIHLSETSGQTTLTDVRFEQEPTDDGGTVAVDVPPGFTLPADADMPLKLKVSGHFPLGTTQVKLLLRSPQLAAPVPFTVEVKQRVSLAWLVGVAAIGAVFSWLLRDVVVGFISRGRAKSQAADLRKRIERLQAEYKDPELDKVIAAQLAALADAIDHPSELAKAVTDVQVALDQGQQDYEAARVEAARRINAALHALAPSPDLPSELVTALEAVQDKVKEAAKELADGKPSTALTAIANAEKQADDTVAAAVARWRDALHPQLEDLASNPDAPQDLRTRVGIVVGELDASPLVEPAGTEAAELIAAVERARHQLLDAIAHVPIWRSAALRAGAILKALSGVDPPAINALIDSALALPAAVTLADVEAEIASLMTLLPALTPAARQAMLEPLSAVNPASKRHHAESLVALYLLDGHFDGAAQVVAQALPAAAQEEMALEYGSHEMTLGLTRKAGPATRAARRGVAPQAVSGLPLKIWDSTQALRIRGWFELTTGRLIQSLLTAVLAVVIVVSLFGADWVGTWSDLTKVFFWGLTVNLSADALMKGASSVAPAAPGP